MTATERDRRIWQIHDIMSRIRPSDMIDAELEAAIAIFRLAEARLAGNKPILRITPRSTKTVPGHANQRARFGPASRWIPSEHEGDRSVPGRSSRSGRQQAKRAGRCDIQLESWP